MQELPYTQQDGIQYIAAKNVLYHHNKFFSQATGYCQLDNNVISIVPITDIYYPQVHDVILARVKQIYQNYYFLDVNSLELIKMKLENINLPGLLRTVNSVDEANMRSFLKEGENIIVEISDNNIARTKNKQFKKCLNGFMFEFPYQLKTFKENFFIKLIDDTKFQIFVGDNGRGWITIYSDSLSDNSVVEINKQVYTQQERESCQKLINMINNQIKNNYLNIQDLDNDDVNAKN